MSATMSWLMLFMFVMLTAPTLCVAVFPHLARAASTNTGNLARTISSVTGTSNIPGATYGSIVGPAFAVGSAVFDYSTDKVTAGGALQSVGTNLASSAVATSICTALGLVSLNPLVGLACIGGLTFGTTTAINNVVGPPSVPQITMCDQMRTIISKVPTRFSKSSLEFNGNTCETSLEWVKAPFNRETYEILLSNEGSITITDRSGDFVIKYKFFGNKELNIAHKLNGAIVTDEPISDFVKQISDILYV